MAARSASRSSSKKAEGMLEPLLSDEDDASTASGSSSSESTEFEKHKPTLMQRLKQAVGKSCDEIEMDEEIVCSSACVCINLHICYVKFCSPTCHLSSFISTPQSMSV
jgi:hypothetical protein